MTITPNPLTIDQPGGGTVIGTFTAHPIGGTGPYTFAWTGTGGMPSDLTTNPINMSGHAPPSDEQNYFISVTVTDNVGATAGGGSELIADGF